MAKALRVNKIFEKVDYHPHKPQRKIHKAMRQHRFCVVCAGRRTGKSTAGGHALLPHVYESYFKREELDPHGKRMEYWIVGPEYSDSEKEFRVLWNDVKKLGFPIDKPGSYNNPLQGDMHLSLWGGRFLVSAKSAKYPDNLVGEGLHGVILAEAAKLKPSIWFKYIRPMLADYRAWALFSSTPEGKNWFYEMWMEGLKEDPEYWSIRMPSWTNDVLFPEGRNDPEILSMEKGLTAEAFNQEVGADFTDFVGRVFKDFDEELHVKPLKFNPELETYACVDYGWTNPFVWLLLQVDYWGRVFVLGEVYGSHKRIEEVHEEIISKGLRPANLHKFYPDPASPGDTRILEDTLRITAEGDTGGELKDRLRLIRKHLEIPPNLRHLPFGHPDRQPKLFVDPSCKNFIREFNDYRYPANKRDADKNDSELPLKKDDHTPEALGRFFKSYFGPKEKTAAPVVVGSSMG